MAREVVVNLWCDFCMAEDPDNRTPGKEYTAGVAVGVQPPKLYSVAACDEHAKERLTTLEELLAAMGERLDLGGQPAKKKAPAKEGVKHGSNEYLVTRASQGIRQGREPKSGVRDAQCLWCPLAYNADSTSGFLRHLRIVHGFEGLMEAFAGNCPVCDRGPYDQLMAHANRSHAELGFTNVTQMYLWARDNGDPYGHYAAVLERKGSLNPEEERKKIRAKESSLPSAPGKKKAATKAS